MSEDSQLLRQYVATRSEPAFAALVQRHLGMVLRAAWRQAGRDEHRARDVAQQVFLLLARKAPGLVDRANLAGWLYSTTRHVVRTLRRADDRRERYEQEAHAMNELNREAAAGLEQRRLCEELDEALQQLGAKDRAALVLRFFESCPLAEVGEAMKTSEDAARMRVDRALDKLRVVLVRRGIKSTAAALGAALTSEGMVAPPAGLAQALATAAMAGGAAGGGGLLAFVATSKGLATASAAAVLLAGGIAWQQVAQARAQLLLLAAEAGVPAKAQNLSVLGGSLLGQVGTLLRHIKQDSLRSEKTIEERWARERAEGAAARAAGEALLAAHPELKAQLNRETRAGFGSTYFLMYRELGWTAAQIATFEGILADGPQGSRNQSYDEMNVDLDAGGKLVVENRKSESVELVAGAGLTEEQTEARLRELLGTEGYAMYANEIFASYWPRILAGRLQALGHPLTVEQAGGLVRAFADMPKRWYLDMPPDRQLTLVADRTGQILSDAQRRVLPLLEAEAWMRPPWNSRSKSP